uniref:Uncharacterized protein n=1 Tax=Oryza glumipatula TaxID=40148 RepID=A0A0E0ANL7_9ORYZ
MVVAADITSGEHRVQMPVQGGGGGGGRRQKQLLAAPEKQLNCFVHILAVIERMGNALGTLAFTWATVVLLGGYPTVLRPEDDFWFATTMVFLEAARMFSRDNRLDYQLFFSTRGAFRLLGWSGLLTVAVYFSVVLVILSRSLASIGRNVLVALLVDMAMLLALGQLLSTAALKLLCDPLRHAISLWSPLLAILLIGSCITMPKSYYYFQTRVFISTNSKTQWIMYLVLSLIVLLATISRLRLPCIRKLVDSFLNTKQLAWRQIILNLCMLAAIVMLVFIFSELAPYAMIVYQLCAVVVVSFGNFQIPAAVVRVVLALLRLVPQKPHKYLVDDKNGEHDSEKNLEPSLKIFYGMVLAQGILYIVACLLEVFSFIPRRYLIRRSGFGGQMGVEYVNLYYAYAFEKCMGGAVLAPKKISLITFAMDSLNSDSSRNKLYGVQMLHRFLKKEQLRTKTITKLTNATKTVASLFDMLGWTSDGDEEIRLFAAKVTAELAGSLRVVQIPGATQLVASLLDTDHQQRTRDHFLFIDSQVGREDSPIQQVGMAEQNSPVLKYLKQMAIYFLIPVDEPSNTHQRNSRLLRWWKQITKRWSVPEEEPSTDQDFLPIQGLLILQRLANFDPGNCMEISRTTGLISKMIDFISYRNHMTSTSEAHQIMLASLSLRVLRRLASTEGKLGVTLRQQILEHTFILSNLAEIMDDNGSSHDLKQLAAEILKNLAMDRNTSEDIGHIRVIISSLMREFLSQDHLLRKNAASLLWNMCENAQPELSNSDLKELSYILREGEPTCSLHIVSQSIHKCALNIDSIASWLEWSADCDGILFHRAGDPEILLFPSWWKRIGAFNCVMLVFTFNGFYGRLIMVVFQVYAFLVVSLGNFQIPVAVVRVLLALQRLVPQNYIADGVSAEQDAGSMCEHAWSELSNSDLKELSYTLQEHRLQMPPAHGGGRQGRQVVAAPEKWLNCFVRVVALMERTGNALGTLAFTWATVVLLGGYPTVPAAAVRVALALLRLAPQNYNGDEENSREKTNLAASLNIFYGMVLGQGVLYIAACLFEVFSFIPRRSLIRHGGFRGQWGVASINLYYAYAFEKYMEGGVLAPKKISLITFAMDSLNSDSPKMQLYGVKMLHIFLQREPIRERVIAKLTASTKNMARLLSMLGWTSSSHAVVRLYAAKATVELAKSLRVITVPGTMQLVSSLLGIDGKQKRGNPLLDVDGDQEGKQDPIHSTSESQEERHDAIRDTAAEECQVQDPLQDTDNLLETHIRSNHINERNSSILRSWQRISEYWSIPKEQPLTDHDLLPALGMSILDNLASCDQNNCVEIDRVTDLIPKIIGFTSFRFVMKNNGAQQMVLAKSSLKVLQRLTSIGGEIGIALRYKISKHPFLLRNLAEILGDNSSDQELSKLVAGILRNLAIDRDTRQEIGHMQVLITRLMKAFLNLDRTSSTNVDCLLPKVAGQALAMLAMDNVHNCLVMLNEPEFTNKLKNMILIHDEKYTYAAASLLCSMCQHAQAKLTESDLKELCHTLREVLERIMNVEGAELEILIGLCAQICKVILKNLSKNWRIKKRFMKRLVDALNANMNPGGHCSGIRRVIIELSIYMMECNSHYANCFNELRMMEALSMVEEMPSRAENYRIFLGDVGFMEYSIPFIALVDRAKELMGQQCLQGCSQSQHQEGDCSAFYILDGVQFFPCCPCKRFSQTLDDGKLSMVENPSSRTENYMLFSASQVTQDSWSTAHYFPLSWLEQNS